MRLIRTIINLIWYKFKYLLLQGKVTDEDNVLGKTPMSRIKVYPNAELTIGKGSGFSNFLSLGVREKMHIGKYVYISQCCHVSDFQHNYKYHDFGRIKYNLIKPTIIHNNVWIGFGCVIISSEIGENSVIGTNSVVINMKIPPNSIFIGDCRLKYKIKKINFKDKKSLKYY